MQNTGFKLPAAGSETRCHIPFPYGSRNGPVWGGRVLPSVTALPDPRAATGTQQNLSPTAEKHSFNALIVIFHTQPGSGQSLVPSDPEDIKKDSPQDITFPHFKMKKVNREV